MMQGQLKAVERMQEYIAEHLDEELTLADLSRVSYFYSSHRETPTQVLSRRG